jgi:hypothetical protein
MVPSDRSTVLAVSIQHSFAHCSAGQSRQVLLEQEEILMLTRRKYLRLAASTLAMPFVSQRVWAQAYPSRPVKIIVGFTPGGLADLSARMPAQALSERLK